MDMSRRSFLHLAAAAAVVMPTPVFAEVSGLRVVSLDYGLTSTLLSLGLPPVGISDGADWKRWVVEPALPPSIMDIGSSYEINFEILLQLKPDIILTTPYLDELLPRLQPIAKVVRLEVFAATSGPVLPAAIAATRKLAVELGRERQADEFLGRADAFFDACRARLAGRPRPPRPPVALVSFMDARHARVYSAPGLFHNALERIGLRNAWTRQSNYWGFETVAIEELSSITDPAARLIVFDPVPPDVLPKLAESPLWQALPFARPGHMSVVPPALMFGMVNEAMRFAGLVTDLLEQDPWR